MKRRRHLSGIFLYLFLATLITSFIISRAYSQFTNTLARNGRWYSTKTTFAKGVMGAHSFMITRNALARFRLDLSAWHGFQEVIYKEPITNIGEAEFDFLLTKDSYIVFIFNKGYQGFCGIRISNNALFKNIFFTSVPNGEFFRKEEIEIPDLKLNSWNHFKADFGNNNAALYINRIPVGKFKLVLLEKQLVGFRGGANKALVDNVLIRQKNSPAVIRESFDNYNFTVFALFLIILSISNLGMAYWSGMLLKNNVNAVIFTIIALNVILAFFSSIFFICDFFDWSSRYPFLGGLMRIELKEKDWLQKETDRRLREIKNKYAIEVNPDVYRILFIGTSQTWGAGASKKSESFVNIIENKLNQLHNAYKYECINASISGLDSSGLLEIYLKKWIALKPKIVVINLSNNDCNVNNCDAGIFASNLTRFSDINKSQDIKTVFVLEANSIEFTAAPLKLHSAMREAGKINRVITLDLHKYLLENYDRGFLWWDQTHLTSFGHKLTADYLFRNGFAALSITD